MPHRSWLAKASSIHEIGAMFYSPKGGEPWDDKQEAQAQARWDRNYRTPPPVSDADRTFFQDRMHDSPLVRIERTKDRVSVRLQSIVAENFAAILADTLDLPQAETLWPTDLVIHDPIFFRAARTDPAGALRFADWESLGEKVRTVFLYDWFFEENDRIQWIAQLYTPDPLCASLSREVYLMADGTRATAIDRCPGVIERTYGSPARRLYEQARANGMNFEEPFNLWNERSLVESLPLRIEAEGLVRADFKIPEPFDLESPS